MYVLKINNVVGSFAMAYNNQFPFFKLLDLINVCKNTLHDKHSLVMSLKERFVARPTKRK